MSKNPDDYANSQAWMAASGYICFDHWLAWDFKDVVEKLNEARSGEFPNLGNEFIEVLEEQIDIWTAMNTAQ